MSLTARKLGVLCVSMSSAQSERDFSSAGRTVKEVRSHLSADTVEAGLIKFSLHGGQKHQIWHEAPLIGEHFLLLL